MKLRYFYFAFGILLLISISCDKTSVIDPDNPSPTLEELYNKAVLDAMIADSSEIFYNLTPITKSNETLIWNNFNGNNYVLVVTFAGYTPGYLNGDTVELTWGMYWYRQFLNYISGLWRVSIMIT